jgi:FMN phosphatase YigB (HAD superfamily)
MVRHLEELFVRNEALDGIRGVIFDLDDTLMDQKRWILSKLRNVHRDFEPRLPEARAFLAKAMAILEEGNRSGLIDALRDSFCLGSEMGRELIKAYRNVSPPEARVFDDVRPLLDELKRRGYRLGILTNNPPRSQRQKIAACGFQDCFDEIVYTQELGAEKPARDGFVEIARRLKLAPEQLVMTGDHLYSDIGGALGAGYAHGFFIQRAGGFFNFDVGIFAEVCGGGEKLTVITSLREMLHHLAATR